MAIVQERDPLVAISPDEMQELTAEQREVAWNVTEDALGPPPAMRRGPSG